MHGAFLHRESHSMFDGETSARFRIRETDRGFFFEKTDQRGVNFDWVEFCRTGVDWVDLEIPYPPTAGPGGPFGIVGMGTPIDDEHHRACSSGATAASRAGSATSGASCTAPCSRSGTGSCSSRTASCSRPWRPTPTTRENLYQHDLGVVRLRRLYKSQAAEQAEQLAGDKEPALV